MYLDPQNRKTQKQYTTKLHWWHDQIIDMMVAEPGIHFNEIARRTGRTPTTISMIVNSDMFRSAYNLRREQFKENLDLGILTKTSKVANAALDSLLVALEKKKDTVPLDTLREVATSSLETLGFGTKAPSNAVTVNATNAQVVLPPTVSRLDLEEARMAVRQVQAQKLIPPRSNEAVQEAEAMEEAGPVESEDEGIPSHGS